MAFAFRSDDSGLVLAEEHRDEAAVSRALKEIDPRLVLQKERANAEGGWKYKVYRIWSEDQPPTPVLTWTDAYGYPLPLTWGLIDKVKVHYVGFRGNEYYVSEDEHNSRYRAALDKQLKDDLAAITEEHKPRLSGRTTVSMSGKLKRRQRDDSPDAPLAHETRFSR